MLLTAEVLRSPTNLDTLLGASMSICRHRCAQAFTVAALVAGAGIKDATLQIALKRYFGMAGRKKVRLQGSTLQLRPSFALWMLSAGIDWCYWGSAMGLQFPGMAKKHRTRFQAQRWCLHVILSVSIVVATQTVNLAAPFVAQFDVNSRAFIPFDLQL